MESKCTVAFDYMYLCGTFFLIAKKLHYRASFAEFNSYVFLNNSVYRFFNIYETIFQMVRKKEDQRTDNAAGLEAVP